MTYRADVKDWPAAIAFRHSGPGGDVALEAEHPRLVRALRSMPPGGSQTINGVTIVRQADGTWDVGEDRHLASPWVVVQSVRSVMDGRPLRPARATSVTPRRRSLPELLGNLGLRLHRHRDEAGYTAVELLVMTPVLVGFIVVAVAAGRFVDADSQVDDAAYAAARAASLEQDVEAGHAAGTEAARSSLADRGKACTNLTVSFAGTDFRASGHVKVEITCHANLSDVVGFGIPGAKYFTATAVVPIEQYRDLP